MKNSYYDTQLEQKHVCVKAKLCMLSSLSRMYQEDKMCNGKKG